MNHQQINSGLGNRDRNIGITDTITIYNSNNTWMKKSLQGADRAK